MRREHEDSLDTLDWVKEQPWKGRDGNSEPQSAPSAPSAPFGPIAVCGLLLPADLEESRGPGSPG